MTDHSHHPQAKLKELIERASTAAEINFKKGREVAPLGFAIRENGSRFAFRPIPAGSGAEMFSMIRATFALPLARWGVDSCAQDTAIR